MATRARIGIQLNNDSVISVYHHWDGYPEWLGRILKTHYNSYEQASELIDGGDMSCAWTNMRWTKDGATEVEEYGAEYYSGRGDDCPPCYDETLEEYLSEGEEYAYLFRNGEWVCYDRHQFDTDKTPKLVEIPSGALAV